jgi:predicted transcriptional regulator
VGQSGPGPMSVPACQPCGVGCLPLLAGGGVPAVDYDAAHFEPGSEMPTGRDVSVIVEQVKARLKQIEDQFGQHQRLLDELERLRDVAKDLARAFVSRLSGGQSSATEPSARAKKPAATTRRTAPARTPRGQNKAKILDTLKRGGPMTATEIAKVSGIPAATVSSTLTRMAKTGEPRKAERGYTLPR